MRHMQGDTIYARDCVLLKSGSRKNDLPFIAKIANLWEDPANGKYRLLLLLLLYDTFTGKVNNPGRFSYDSCRRLSARRLNLKMYSDKNWKTI